MKLRGVVLAAAGLGIPLAALILFSPVQWGYGGYFFAGDKSGLPRITVVNPGSPAQRAGLRAGDHFTGLTGLQNLENIAGPVGTTVTLDVLRHGKTFPLQMTFEPFPDPLAQQEAFTKIVSALTAIGVFTIGIIVMLRARYPQAGARAAVVLIVAGWYANALSGALVAPNVWLASAGYFARFALIDVLPCTAMMLLAIYPPTKTRIRTMIGYAAPWLLGAGLIVNACVDYGAWASPPLWNTLGGAFAYSAIALSAILAVGLIDAIASAPLEFRTATRWVCGCWLAASAILIAQNIVAASRANVSVNSHYGDIIFLAQMFLWAFGVAYPVLRHRLVDLNILITRATIFAAVSLIIVCIFVATEWSAVRIFEHSINAGHAPKWLLDGITLAIVLTLGLSARWIHQFVEARLSQIFFRKRLMGLAEIQRLAREVDAATDAQAVMALACTTVKRCLEPLGVACYIRTGDAYPLVSSNGAVVSPAAYSFNDEIPLRLRRFLEPFEIDDNSDERFHMLFLPMTLRGEVLGFLCCGPKPDRTPYPRDEVDALAFLAHQIGIASAWLQREPALQ